MARSGPAGLSVGVAILLGLAGAWVAPASTEAAYTWEGTWDTSFGPLTMDAGGDGSYPDYSGTIDGTISGTDGRTNSGTWTEPSSNGTYTFSMTSAFGFEGTYARAPSTTTCPSPPCTWDGACAAGPCLENSAGYPCTEPEERKAARREPCLYEVPFAFDLLRGMPSEPRASELVPDLVSVAAHTTRARLFAYRRKPAGGEFLASGDLTMTTRYEEPGGDTVRRLTDFRVGPTGYYDKEPGTLRVEALLRVANSEDLNCPAGVESKMTLTARKTGSGRTTVRLEIQSIPSEGGTGERVPCLTADEFGVLAWKTHDFRRVKIGRPRLVSPGS